MRAILARTAWSFDLRVAPIGVRMLLVAAGPAPAPVAIDMATGGAVVYHPSAVLVAMIALAATAATALLGRGLLRLTPAMGGTLPLFGGSWWSA